MFDQIQYHKHWYNSAQIKDECKSSINITFIACFALELKIIKCIVTWFIAVECPSNAIQNG